jgi:ElaB/YqjD/DUF883 family membrane-anchored ribosome-binding protein
LLGSLEGMQTAGSKAEDGGAVETTSSVTEVTAERSALPPESDADSRTEPPENLGPRPSHRVAWLPIAAIWAVLVGLGMLGAGVTVLLSVTSISNDAEEMAADRAETEAELAAVREEIESTQASTVGLADAQTALQDDVDAVISAADELMAAAEAFVQADNARVGVHDAVIERGGRR